MKMRVFLSVFALLLSFQIAMPVKSEARSPEPAFNEQGDFVVQQNHFIEMVSKDIVCEECIKVFTHALNETGKVASVTPDLEQNKFHIVFKEGASMSDEELTKLVTDLGYSVESIKHGKI